MKKTALSYINLITVLMFSLGCGKKSNVNPSSTTATTAFDITVNNAGSNYLINNVAQLSDGGFLLAGALGLQNVVMKYNSSGQMVWQHILTGPDLPRGFTGLCLKNDQSFIAYDPYGFTTDPAIFSFDSNGNTISSNSLPGSVSGNSIIAYNDGYLIGGINNEIGGAFQYIVNGVSSWDKSFQFDPAVLSVSKNQDGTVIAIGGGNYSGTGNYLKKLDQSGNLLWQLPYSGYVVQTLTNNSFLAITENDQTDEFTMFDGTGKLLWTIDNIELDPFAYDMGALNIFNLDNNHFVFTIARASQVLLIYVVDINGKILKTITEPSISPFNHVAITATADNGLLIVVTNNQNDIMQLIKLPNLLN